MGGTDVDHGFLNYGSRPKDQKSGQQGFSLRSLHKLGKWRMSCVTIGADKWKDRYLLYIFIYIVDIKYLLTIIKQIFNVQYIIYCLLHSAS